MEELERTWVGDEAVDWLARSAGDLAFSATSAAA